MWMDRSRSGAGTTQVSRQLAEDFARYAYLPRLKEPLSWPTRCAGLALLTWEQGETFAGRQLG